MKAKKMTVSFDEINGEISRQEECLAFVDESGLLQQRESNVVGIYPQFTYQKVEGYGCAMTESASYLLSRMKEGDRKAALGEWFGPEGVGARFIRIPIDSCDYSLEEYQAVREPLKDLQLQTFTIDRDRKYIIPMVKEALAMSGEQISVLLSPWSPPADWKTPPKAGANDLAVYGNQVAKTDFSKPGRCYGGSLKPEYYGSWARYLVKYVQAYLEEGIPVSMLSVQNEASAATAWDSCVWSGEEEKKFLRDYLYPELERAGLAGKVGLYIWDHNKERMVEHILEIMDQDTEKMVEGFAYHWYSGDHFDALSMLKERYPEKVFLHSESCGLHIPGQAFSFELTEDIKERLPEGFVEKISKITPGEMDYRDAVSYAHDMIGDLNHGMNRWIDWNLAVDRKGGPRHVPGGFAAPIIAEEDGSFTETVSFHYIRQIARTLRSDSVRLGCSVFGKLVEATAVRNTDGSIGLAMLNDGPEECPIAVRLEGHLCETSLPAHTLVTMEIQE